MKVKLLKKLRKRFMWFYKHDIINPKYTFKCQSAWHIWDNKDNAYHIKAHDTEALSYMLQDFGYYYLSHLPYERERERIKNIRRRVTNQIKEEQKVKFFNNYQNEKNG